MLVAAAALAVCLLLLVVVFPGLLARSAWPHRAPSYALVLWQAAGLSGGLLALEITVTVALAPAGATQLGAIAALRDGEAGPLPWWSWAAFALAALLFARLLSVLVVSAGRTLLARRRHRVLVDLVATRNPLLAGTRVVDHDVPLAYCLPGLRPRVVVSRGVLALLREDEIRAVLAHETAHLQQRHDLVVLPFAALGATFPGLPAVRIAREQVALLVEMLADDHAARRHPPVVLARALYKVGASGYGGVPDGGLGALGPDPPPAQPVLEVTLRAQRLVCPPPSLPFIARVAVLLGAAALLGLPVLGLVLPR